MDYDYPLTGHPAVQPRHYYWESRVDYKGTTTYGLLVPVLIWKALFSETV